MAALGKLHDPLIHWFNSHPDPPVAIISDFFLVGPLSLTGPDVSGRGNSDSGSNPNDQMVLTWLDGLLVEEMGVSVRVCEGADSVPDSDELGRAIAESMSDGGGLKLKAKELKEKALAAVSNGGSSIKDMDRLVEEINKLGSK
ncbi:UDP-glucuronosyl/UDP-glucosyltransferase [Corchorus capsularis]|uniref:UDP-glucuronosyl/UDP-glucosyltransferase n=1 Tax=Corchorus capsularis TaxID=210143 RepID=A0A1R3JFQ1_COCAP|nr:UDP-glucuronosyl/UDP-glucosyltransferase [Corchorus capsularis]